MAYSGSTLLTAERQNRRQSRLVPKFECCRTLAATRVFAWLTSSRFYDRGRLPRAPHRPSLISCLSKFETSRVPCNGQLVSSTLGCVEVSPLILNLSSWECTRSSVLSSTKTYSS